MKLFGPDSGLYKFISRFWDVVKLSVLWIVFSIPVITIGPATVALAAVTMKMVDDTEGYVARQFVTKFKENLRNGIPLGIIFVICLEIVNLDVQLFEQVEGNPMILLISAFVAGFCVFMGFIYAFHLSARYENTLVNTIKNSVNVATRFFLRSLLLLLVIGGEFFLMFFNLTTLFVGVLIGPASVSLTISGFFVPFYRQLEKEPGTVSEYQETPGDADYRMPEEENIKDSGKSAHDK